MTDDTTPQPDAAPDSATAVASPQEEQAQKLRQQVEIMDLGMCKKHIKVTVDRADIDERMREVFAKLAPEANMTGFRPGKAPRKLVEKRYHKEVCEQVKREVLYASLDQLGSDHDVAPLAPPQIDLEKLEIPKVGPMVYEFTVEVRPEFDLPPVRGLKLKRPIKNFTDADVAEARRQMLTVNYGTLVDKGQGPVAPGDVVVGDLTIRYQDTAVGHVQDTSMRVEKQLAFRDGIIENFATQMKGAKVGDSRVLDCKLSSRAAKGFTNLTVKAHVHVKAVKTHQLPELTDEFCRKELKVNSVDHLNEKLRAELEKQFEHNQRSSFRLQILQQLTRGTNWQLPEELLLRNYIRTRNRRIMEMRGDGLSDAQIAQRLRLMEQDLLTSTAIGLKEHFVLQKIAEQEKFEIKDEDIDDEIVRLAEASGESPRRLRAKLEKDELMEALMADMLERRALDLVLDSAEYADVPIEPEEDIAGEVAMVEAQAVPGEMLDPTAAAEEAAPEKAPESQEGQ